MYVFMRNITFVNHYKISKIQFTIENCVTVYTENHENFLHFTICGIDFFGLVIICYNKTNY